MAEGETLDQGNNAQGNEWETLHDEDGLTPEEVEAAWRRRLGRNPEGEAALGPNYNILSQDMGLFPEGVKPQTEPPIDDGGNDGPDNGGDDKPDDDDDDEPGEDDNGGGDDIEVRVDPIPPIPPNPPEDGEDDEPDDEKEDEDNDDDDDGDDWADEHLKDPLTAVEAGFDFDAEQLARVEAEETINRETKGKFFQRLWKKTLFKKYYERKYTDEIMAGECNIKVMEGGDENREMSIREIMERRSDSTIQRFVMAAITGEREQFLSEEIGGKQGETMVEADKKTYDKVKSTIEWFAQAEIPEGQTLEDLKRSFRQRMGYERAANKDKGELVDDIRFNNYLEVAIQAREAVEHHVSMERVMDGFKVYEAEARSGFKTEEHRDNVDKAINWLENRLSGVGLLVPAQALAAGASVVSFFAKGSIGALFGAFGGIAANGVIAGLRERNRITEDRAHMLRNASIDRVFAGTSEAIAAKEQERSRKQEKYEAKIGGTLYQLEKATDLESDIAKAMESEGDERGQNILSAIAAAEARIELSNSEAKDLIAFSSADKRGDEYLKLLTTIHKAKKLLSDDEKGQLDIIKNRISKDVLGNVAEQDAKFGNTRALMTLEKTAKSIGVGTLTFFGSQEMMALVDPSKLGLLEKLGLINTANKADANQTILTELFTGPNIQTHTVNLSEYDVAQRDALKGAGYKEVMTTPPGTRTETSVTDVALSQSRARIKYDTLAWADNGTSYSDYNELRIGGNGADYLTCVMHGKSTYGGGNVIDYAQELAAGHIKGIMTMADGSQFEIMPFVDDAGQMAFSHAGDYITTDGSIISGVGDGFRFFQIMADRGGNAGISLATEVGKGTFSGNVQEVVNKIVNIPAEYTLSLSENIAMDTSGFFLPSFWPRTGLGASRQRPRPQEPERPPRESVEPEPDDTPHRQERVLEQEPEDGIDSPPPPPSGPSGPGGAVTREQVQQPQVERRQIEEEAVRQQIAQQVAQARNIGFDGVQMPDAEHINSPLVTPENYVRPIGVRPTQDVPPDRVTVVFPDIPQEVEGNLRQIYQDWASTFEQRERENNPAIDDDLIGHYHNMVEAARGVIGDRGVQLLTEPNVGSVELQNLDNTPEEFGQILGEHLNMYYNELDEAGRAAVVQYFEQLRDTQGIEGFSTSRLGALDREEFSAWYNQLDDNQQHQIDRLLYDLSNNRMESWYNSLDNAGKQAVYRLFGLRDRMQRYAVNARVEGAPPTKGIDEALGFVYWMNETKDPWGNQWVRGQNEPANTSNAIDLEPQSGNPQQG